MNQDPEHEDYDDDDYKYYPEYNEHGYPQEFKIDWDSWEKWLKAAMQEIISDQNGEWIVASGYLPKNQQNKENEISQKFLYFGQNQYDESIWKYKYFICNYFDQQYKNHFMSHASHILRQPAYYRGMFDMLN